MPYEQPIPPLPTREQELQSIKNIEKDFLSQPWTKYYMNEALRATKLEDSYKMNYIKKNWYINFCAGALITGLLLFPMGRLFHRFKSGVPHYYRNKMYYVDFDAHNQGRNLKTLQYQLPLWAGLSYWYADYFTDYSLMDDEYYERIKVKKMF